MSSATDLKSEENLAINKISPQAKIGSNVKIGDYTIIHDNVEIGDNTVISSHCEIGVPSRNAKGPLVIGANSTIRSHSIFYEGSSFECHLVTGHAVTVRENTIAGRYLQIGTNSDIEGECQIGDYVKLHAEVHISQLSKVGDLVWFFPRVQFTNDPYPPSQFLEGIVVEDLAVVTTNATLLPGVRIGFGAFVAAGSVVKHSVDPCMCVEGNPAKVFSRLDRFVSFKYGVSYPWPKHFRQGYPEEAYARMDELVKKIEEYQKLNKPKRRKRVVKP